MRRIPERRLNRMSLFFIRPILTPTPAYRQAGSLFPIQRREGPEVRNILRNKMLFFKEDLNFERDLLK